MQIETIPIAKLRPSPYNPRKDLKPGDPEYEKLRASISEFGDVDPIIWNKRTGNVVGGHQRLKVLQELGHTEATVSVVDLPLAKEQALNIALNKIRGEWDWPKLKDVLLELDTGEIDLTLTGFEMAEIEDLMTDVAVWRPDKDLLEGEGDTVRRVIITFQDEAEQIDFWARLGRPAQPTDKVLYRWRELRA